MQSTAPSKYRQIWPAGPVCNHVVQFYEDERFLIDEIGRDMAAALDAGEGAIVIATQPHRDALHQYLRDMGKDIAGARLRGRYVVLDAAETLSQFMVDDWPDERRFTQIVGGRIAALSAEHGHVRAFGEMVALLWAAGKADAAIALEKLWNGLAEQHSFALRCAYPIDAFSHHSQTENFLKVCAEHSVVVPSERRSGSSEADADAHNRVVAELQQKTRALSTEIDEHKKTSKALQENVEELTLVDHRKTEFLAMLGDELRNPLSPILSALGILQLPGADAAAVRIAHEAIGHQTRRLARIVDDLVDVTRTSSGEIEARDSDAPGRGSRFVVAPQARGSATAVEDDPQAATGRPGAGSASHRILIVDDNHDGADNLVLLCRMYGHEVDVAYDGMAGVERASAFRPDVVLLDIGLPGCDGYAVAREVRRSRAGDQLRIIGMTGYGRDEDRRRSRDAGFDLHLVKPIEPAQLFDLLSRPLDAMIDRED
jgi:CheY-like chemotaxis protein